ncbi:MAG TPA: zf-HC2 domain-containing protein [Pyrinomonadaceae bacterium]|nr:zf-HC2 domain-containing protein [Pyrinomonadaceae bacterium]
MRYLLGLASPAEREHVESEYFHDADAFERMLAAEDDLIDAYARGELSDEERRRFEQRFLKSTQGKDRVQFSRALTRAVAPPVQTTRWYSLRVAAIAAVVVIAVILAWLVVERRRMNNELRDLRAAHEQLHNETEALRRDAERPHIAELQPQPTALPPANRTPRKTIRSQTQRDPRALTTFDKESLKEFRVITATAAEQIENNGDATLPPKSQQVVSAPTPEPKQASDTVAIAGHADAPINIANATLGNTFERRRIVELPLNSGNVVNLLSLQPGVTRQADVAGARAAQSNITLDGVDIAEPANLPTWTRFRFNLKKPAKYTDYRVTLETKGRHVTSIEWIEPVTANQTIIETPIIETTDLPAGDYKLTLAGKKTDGSFVKVAENSLKVGRK